MKKFSLALCVLFLLLILQTSAFACACCAEPGTYSIWTGKADGYYLDVVDGIKFDNKAYLYTTEAGFDMIKGLSEVEKEYASDSWTASSGNFDLTGSYAAKSWKLNFKTPGGKTGTLNLPMPAQMLTFKVDIHDGKTGGGGGPLLYKEFRFKGNVGTGSGFFQKGIVKPTSYFLVFKGRGNGCDNSEDFTHWYLEIRGKNAQYEFFGKLDSANPELIFDEETEEDEEDAEEPQTISDSEIVEQLRGIEERLANAWVTGDRAFIEQVLADDWSVTDAAGRVLKKSEVLEETFGSKDRQISSIKIDDVSVRPKENWAIVTGRTKAAGKYRGEAMEVTLRFTDVFENRNGNWQVVASHAVLLNQ